MSVKACLLLSKKSLITFDRFIQKFILLELKFIGFMGVAFFNFNSKVYV